MKITIRRLKSGKYNAVIPYVDEYGKRKQKSFTADTEARAYKMAQDYIDGIVYFETDKTITLKKAMKQYIDARVGIIEPTTIRNYRQIAKNSFKMLHNMRICDLNAATVQIAVSKETQRVSPKYIRNAFGFLMSVLRMYEVATNFSSVRLPKLVRKEKELPDFETILDIFKGDEIELPVLLAAWMSLRIGEVTGLQFRDVDEEKKLLHVRRTLIMTENGLELREGCKTEKSTRTLPIPDYILDLIKAIPHNKDTDPIITITQKALRSRFKRRVVKRGYDITFHDLRHFNASVMLMIGVPNKYAMERGGWSTDNVLKSVYQQTFTSERIKVDKMINEYFNDIIKKRSSGNG